MPNALREMTTLLTIFVSLSLALSIIFHLFLRLSVQETTRRSEVWQVEKRDARQLITVVDYNFAESFSNETSGKDRRR